MSAGGPKQRLTIPPPARRCPLIQIKSVAVADFGDGYSIRIERDTSAEAQDAILVALQREGIRRARIDV